MPSYRLIRTIFIALLAILFALCYVFSMSYWLLIIPIFVFVAYTTYGVLYPSSQIFIPVFYSFNYTSKNLLAITFDDGPSPESLEILEILKKHDVKATFFCIGKHLKQYPEIAQKMVDEGHQLANHSFSHDFLFPLLGKSKIQAEIGQTNQLLKTITGEENTLFRPPYGVLNPQIATAVKNTNMKVIGWNIRSFDTVVKQTDELINRIDRQLKPGSVLLLHDNRKSTVLALDALLSHIVNQGYQMVTIRKMIEETHA